MSFNDDVRLDTSQVESGGRSSGGGPGGLVVGGGIGMALDTALNLFQWDRVALILFSIFMIVIAAEIVVGAVRKRVL